jgi:hypothetical protein
VATVAPCGLCHTPAGAFVGFYTGRTLAGGMEARWRVYGRAVSSNLTPTSAGRDRPPRGRRTAEGHALRDRPRRPRPALAGHAVGHRIPLVRGGPARGRGPPPGPAPCGGGRFAATCPRARRSAGGCLLFRRCRPALTIREDGLEDANRPDPRAGRNRSGSSWTRSTERLARRVGAVARSGRRSLRDGTNHRTAGREYLNRGVPASPGSSCFHRNVPPRLSS